MPNYWILKTDTDTYSFDDLAREHRAVWDGVSNALALKHIRSMAKGDQVLIYQSGNQ
jgi:predicted RNA-binding protein with PUA-like domain